MPGIKYNVFVIIKTKYNQCHTIQDKDYAHIKQI